MIFTELMTQNLISSIRRIQKGKRFFYEATFLSGEKATYLRMTDYIMVTNYVDQLADQKYCGVCNDKTDHLLYRATDEIRCLECTNKLGENDVRKEASVISLRTE